MAPVFTASVYKSSAILLVGALLSPSASAYSDFSTKCTKESCDVVEGWIKDEISGSGVVSYTTSQDNADRLTKRVSSFEDSDNGGWQKIKIDASKTYQKIQG